MNNVLFFGLIIIFITLLLPYQVLYAQLNDAKFNTYNNPNFGIKIQYPSDWDLEENDSDFDKDVIFLVPTSPKKYMDKLSIGILDAEPNQSLNDLVNELIEFNKKEMTGYEVIESTPIILNGNNAHKIVYTDNSELFGDVKGMLIETIKGDKIYEILYTTEPERYDELLHIIQKMINSFEITN